MLPAYEADLFAAAATVAGPVILIYLLKMAEVNAINELLTDQGGSSDIPLEEWCCTIPL